MIHDLDVVTVGVDHKRRVVPLVVVRALARAVCRGSRTLHAESTEDAFAIDRLVDFYVGAYQDIAGVRAYPSLDNRWLYVSRWIDARDRSAGRLDALLGHLLDGRGIGRRDGIYPYASSDGVFRVGFWTLDEVRELSELFITPSDAQAATRDALDAALARQSGLVTIVA